MCRLLDRAQAGEVVGAREGLLAATPEPPEAPIRRILEIATIDALGLENSIARARVLIAGALAAA